MAFGFPAAALKAEVGGGATLPAMPPVIFRMMNHEGTASEWKQRSGPDDDGDGDDIGEGDSGGDVDVDVGGYRYGYVDGNDDGDDRL